MIIKKLVALFTIVIFAFGQVAPVLAQEAPPTPPSAPSAPSAPPAPTPPAPPEAPAPPAAPGPSDPTPTPEPTVQPTPRPTRVPTPTPTVAQSAVISELAANQPGGNNTDGQMGGSTINTGNATVHGELVTDANANLAGTVAEGALGDSGTQIVNSGNGDSSSNSGSAQIVDSQTTAQNNSAVVVNAMEQQAVTGQNSASSNTGGDANITTGDSNVSGILLNTINTNSAGVMMSEFDIADDHMGDYVLDFAANCVYGCAGGPTSVINSGNGADSTNDGSVVEVIDSSTFQINTAEIDNAMTLDADSGHNRADRNTGGNSNILTGDANVSASAVTMANNNIAGNVLYGVVNIYGDLVGDIVFPEEQLANCCGGPILAANTGNGANSTNSADVTNLSTDTTVQTNIAAINNTLLLDAQSGDNDANRNTGGNSAITTGDTSVTAQVLNVANSNIVGDWWLVLVNEAGEWVGRIMGAPEGTNFLGSAGTEMRVGENGEINVSNSGNGDSSTNIGSVTTVQDQTTVQTNNLTLNNTLDLGANTGSNSTSRNTNGNNSIVTGDATIVANLVNFVNNNISGSGRLVVTVVNVFGSWLGNFVGPGQHQDEDDHLATTQQHVGGADVETNSSTSTPTPTIAPIASTALAATATPSHRPALLASNNVGSGNATVAVAGFTTEKLNEIGSNVLGVKSKRSIRVNLAWLLLLLPVGGIFLITKKKLLH